MLKSYRNLADGLQSLFISQIITIAGIFIGGILSALSSIIPGINADAVSNAIGVAALGLQLDAFVKAKRDVAGFNKPLLMIIADIILRAVVIFVSVAPASPLSDVILSAIGSIRSGLDLFILYFVLKLVRELLDSEKDKKTIALSKHTWTVNVVNLIIILLIFVITIITLFVLNDIKLQFVMAVIDVIALLATLVLSFVSTILYMLFLNKARKCFI